VSAAAAVAAGVSAIIGVGADCWLLTDGCWQLLFAQEVLIFDEKCFGFDSNASTCMLA